MSTPNYTILFAGTFLLGIVLAAPIYDLHSHSQHQSHYTPALGLLLESNSFPEPVSEPNHDSLLPHYSTGSSHGYGQDHFVHGYDHINSPALNNHHQYEHQHVSVAEPHHVPLAEPHHLHVAEPHHIPVAEPHHIPVAEHHHLPVAEPRHLPVAEPHHIPVDEPHHLQGYGHQPVHDLYHKEHTDLHDDFYHNRLPGDGFGPGGYFSPMPKPELKLVPIPEPVPVAEPIPVDKPYPVPVDKPYPVPIDRPFPKPYISKVIQPVIHKTAVIKSHVSHLTHEYPFNGYHKK